MGEWEKEGKGVHLDHYKLQVVTGSMFSFPFSLCIFLLHMVRVKVVKTNY